METNNRTDCESMVRKMQADKEQIEAHYDDPDSVDISDIRFTKPLSLPIIDEQKNVDEL